MTPCSRLDDFPKLATWLRERRQTGDATGESLTIAATLVRAIAEALEHWNGDGDAYACRRFKSGLSQFTSSSKRPLEDFLGAEALADRLGLELLDMVASLSELALRVAASDGLYEALKSAADATGLAVLRFLAAWAAFNTGQAELAVSECDKVDQPFAPIHTLQGQALLDLGRAQEAVESLEVAVGLAPSDTVAWFQLAKAHHVLGRFTAAFHALRTARRLAPQSDEVALYMGLIALDQAPTATAGLAAEALAALRPPLKRHTGNPIVAITLLRLAHAVGDKALAREVIRDVDWPVLMGRPETPGLLPPLLSALGDSAWYDLASEILTSATVAPPATCS